MAKGITKHAVIRVPHLVRDEAVILATAREMRCSFRDAYMHLLDEREAVIAGMESDPLQRGWEPPIWAVADALLGLDLNRPEWKAKTEIRGQRSDGSEYIIREGLEWEEWAERLRSLYGFEKPVQVLWASGANRSSKSTWASKRTVEVMLSKEGAVVWCLDRTGPISIDHQQAWTHGFLPSDIRAKKAIKSQLAYVNWSSQNGFTGQKFTLPGVLSKCLFMNYMQEKMLVEGGEIDWCYCEENVAPDWLETIRGRVGGGRKAKVTVAFTPINGWNGTVNLFMQNAVVVKSSPAFLLPADGGEPDVVRALGFQTLEEMEEAHRDERWSVPENVYDWVHEEPEKPMARQDLAENPVRVQGSEVRGQRSETSQTGYRLFERMPRIMRCPDFNAAIVFFHPMDNPFGNPLDVWETWRSNTTEVVRRRMYGWATETTSPVFTSFDENVHVIPAADIPKDGTNYVLIDPAGKRNWFMIWVRVTRLGKAYVYREWPGPYLIKGAMLGAWAEVSGKKEGVNDGKKGPAQNSIAFTIRNYVAEWARLEGWPAGWEKIVAQWESEAEDEEATDEYGDRVGGSGIRGQGLGINLSAFRGGGDEGDLPLPDAGAKEKIFSRIMDCRAMNTASQSKQGVVTHQTILGDMGIDVEASVPVSINGTDDSGIDLVNARLGWNRDLPLGPDNCPDLMFSESVPNVIWCVQNWRNVDGNKGASKDPVDLVRYFCAGDYGYEG